MKLSLHMLHKIENVGKIVTEHDQEIPQLQTQTNPWHSDEEPHNNH